MKQVVIPWTNGTGNITLTFTGQGNDTVIVASDDNSLDVARSQAITVKTADGSVHRTVIVTQEAGSHSQPYDAEIEYLRSNGTACIDTGLAGNINGNLYKIGFKATSYKGAQANGIIGTHNTANPYNRAYIAYLANNLWEFGHETYERVDGFYLNTYYDIILDTTNDRYKVIANQTEIKNVPFYEDRATANILIGAVYLTTGEYTAIGEYYYSKIYDSDGVTLLMDLIPVRVGNTGYMYDKVSGQLFGNSGTGNFILGPDIQ